MSGEDQRTTCGDIGAHMACLNAEMFDMGQPPVGTETGLEHMVSKFGMDVVSHTNYQQFKPGRFFSLREMNLDCLAGCLSEKLGSGQ